MSENLRKKTREIGQAVTSNNAIERLREGLTVLTPEQAKSIIDAYDAMRNRVRDAETRESQAVFERDQIANSKEPRNKRWIVITPT